MSFIEREDAPPRVTATRPEDDRAVALYLDLLKKCLSRFAFAEKYSLIPPSTRQRHLRHAAYRVVYRLLTQRGFAFVRLNRFDPDLRREGRDFPADAETMIGLKRLDQLHDCIASVVRRRRCPADLLEAGVWRGGTAIFMRAVLEAYGDEDRTVWLADSFEGLPKPDPTYPADSGDRMFEATGFAVSVDEVKANFRRYGLLDDRVRFIKGWFKDTLEDCDVDPSPCFGSTVTCTARPWKC